MQAGDQVAQLSSQAVIPGLRAYRNYLLQEYGGLEAMASTITAVSDQLADLESLELQATDNSEAMQKALADLTEANKRINAIVRDQEQTQKRIEEAAAIVALVQRAISFATQVG